MPTPDETRQLLDPTSCNDAEFKRRSATTINKIFKDIDNIYNILETLPLTVRHVDASTIITNVRTLEFGDCSNVVYDRGANTARVITGPFTHVVQLDGGLSAWTLGPPTTATASIYAIDPDNGGLVDTGDDITVNYIGKTALSSGNYFLAHKDEFCDWWISSPGCCDNTSGGGSTGTDPPPPGGGDEPGDDGDTGGGGGGGGGGGCTDCPDNCEQLGTELVCASGTRSYQYDVLFDLTSSDYGDNCFCGTLDGETVRVTRNQAFKGIWEANSANWGAVNSGEAPSGECAWRVRFAMPVTKDSGSKWLSANCQSSGSLFCGIYLQAFVAKSTGRLGVPGQVVIFSWAAAPYESVPSGPSGTYRPLNTSVQEDLKCDFGGSSMVLGGDYVATPLVGSWWWYAQLSNGGFNYYSQCQPTLIKSGISFYGGSGYYWNCDESLEGYPRQTGLFTVCDPPRWSFHKATVSPVT